MDLGDVLVAAEDCIEGRKKSKYCVETAFTGLDRTMQRMQRPHCITGQSLQTWTPNQRDRVVQRRYPFLPDEATRTADRMTHRPQRTWCVKGCTMEDHHCRRDRSKMTVPEIQLDYVFLGTTALEGSTDTSSMVSILHAVDNETLMRTAVVRSEG